jgi:hypothetical protein
MKTQYDTSTRLASKDTCHNVVSTSLRFYYYLSGYSLEDWVNNHNNYFDNNHHYYSRAVAQLLVTLLPPSLCHWECLGSFPEQSIRDLW